MNLQIDHHVKAVFDDIVAAAPDIGPAPSSELGNDHGRSQRAWLAIAAVAMLVFGVAAIVGARAFRSEPGAPAATTPMQPLLSAGVPALLEPDASSGLTVTNRSRFAPEQPTAGGAILAPDGTVFGLGLAPTAPLDIGALPDNYDERTLAGWPAWGFVDGSAPEEIYRGIEVDCATLSLTTAGEPMWSGDIERLAGSVQADETTLTIELPDGWTSLGTTTIGETFNSTIAATVDGADYRVRLTQAVGAPIGALLGTMETNPVTLTAESGALWHIEGATTPGWNTLVGLRRDIAFSLTGSAPVEVLTKIVDSLIAVPADGWLQRPTEPVLSDETDMAESVGTLPDCPLQQLDVTAKQVDAGVPVKTVAPQLRVESIEVTGAGTTSRVELAFDSQLPDIAIKFVDNFQSVDSTDAIIYTIQRAREVNVCESVHSFPPPADGTVDVLVPASWFARVEEPNIGPIEQVGQPAKFVTCGPYQGYYQYSIWGPASVDPSHISVTIKNDRSLVVSITP